MSDAWKINLAQNTIKLIVGLCNPGVKYQNTRHNVGAHFVRTLVKTSHLDFLPEAKLKGLHARLLIGSEYCHMLLPTTYMNHSGQAVKAITDFYKIPLESILIAHDELDLGPGIIKLKQSGGHGGHNGIKDIISQLGSNNFLRLRIGIGRPIHEDVSDYVLSDPSVDEQIEIDRAIQRSLDILPDLFAGKIDHAMKTLHSK